MTTEQLDLFAQKQERNTDRQYTPVQHEKPEDRTAYLRKLAQQEQTARGIWARRQLRKEVGGE